MPFHSKQPARISALVLDALAEVAGDLFHKHGDRRSAIVGELSRMYTRERQALRVGYLDKPDHAAAYLTYFLPVNLSKIQVLLDELPLDTFAGHDGGKFSVLDLGSGPGTGAMAVLDWLHHRHRKVADALSVVAVDASPTALQQGKRLWGHYCRETGQTGAGFLAHVGNLEHGLRGQVGDQVKQTAPYDLIILANCLNEIGAESIDPTGVQATLAADALALLQPHGTLIVIEPALRETSRALHRVRDRLVHEQGCTVYSPCLHERNCPALEHADDWCHEERAWEPPRHIQHIDQELGLIKDALKFSYLLLRTDGRTIVTRHSQIFRIVSEMRILKGDMRAWLCNELGRGEVGRLDRALSPANSGWDHGQRGTIVRITDIVRKERKGRESAVGRIPRDALVEIVRRT